MTHIIMCNVLVWFGFILKSCLSVFATLQKRLSEALEAVDEGLDPTLTGDLRVHGLCRVLWLVTRQKPNVQICRLRVDDYAELNTRLRKVHQKILSISSDVQAALSALKNELLLTEEFVSALAETQGFEETWLYEVEAKVSRGRGPKAVAAAKAADIANNQRLPDMIRQRLPVQPAAGALPAVGALLPPPPAPVQPGPLGSPPAAAAAAAPASAAGIVGPPAKAPPQVPQGVRAVPVQSLPPVPAPPVAPPVPAAPNGHVEAEGAPSNGGSGNDAQHEEEALDYNLPYLLYFFFRGLGWYDFVQQFSCFPSLDGLYPQVLAELVQDAVGDAGAPGAAAALPTPIIEGQNICAICQQELAPQDSLPDAVQMLACGHVFHRDCLNQSWRIGNHERGWCPFRCNVRAMMAEMEAEFPEGGSAPADQPEDDQPGLLAGLS